MLSDRHVQVHGGLHRLVPRQHRRGEAESEGTENHYLKIFVESKIFQSARSSRDPHTHEISRVEARDEGLYTCVVGNGKHLLLSKVPQFRHRTCSGAAGNA